MFSKYRDTSNISRILVGNKLADHWDVLLPALLQLHLYSGLNTWHQWIGERHLQDEPRYIDFWDLVRLLLEVWWHELSALCVVVKSIKSDIDLGRRRKRPSKWLFGATGDVLACPNRMSQKGIRYDSPQYLEFRGKLTRNVFIFTCIEMRMPHDDVFKWKHFSRYWPFVKGSSGHLWIPITKTSDVEVWCFLWSMLNKRLGKQSRRRWFETPSCWLRRHCNGATVHIVNKWWW